MSTIPTLTEQNIRTFVGEQNFQKGQQLAHDGAILNPQQQVMALKAYCYGSLPEPYRVQVTFDSPRINAYLCSCPAGASVYANRGCEHAAALLLTWIEQPEAFVQTDDIDTILERQSTAQLIKLVKQLLQKQPEVEWDIAGRGRSNYQVACSYLVKIRSLHEKLDETGQWTTYIAWLRKRHSRLSTLKYVRLYPFSPRCINLALVPQLLSN